MCTCFGLYCHIIFYLSVFNLFLSIFAISDEMNMYFVNQFYSDLFVTLQVCAWSEDVHGFWKLSSLYIFIFSSVFFLLLQGLKKHKSQKFLTGTVLSKVTIR